MRNRIFLIAYIFLFLVCFKALSYWLISWWQHPGAPLSTIVMYRVSGDEEYFPLISALSQFEFGEFYLYEFKGTGMLSFPFVTIFPHALFYRFFGLFGFILADIFIALVIYIILSRLFNFIGISYLLARSTSLLIVTGAADFISSRLLKLLRPLVSSRNSNLIFWGWRIPRPFVSEIFFIGFVYCILTLSYSQNSISRKRYWFILGLCTAALLQGDFHLSITMIISIFCFILFLLIYKRELRIYIVKGIFLFFATLVISSVPFFLQRIFENQDIPRRLGLFPIARTKSLLLYDKFTYPALLVLFGFGLLLLLLIRYSQRIDFRKRVANNIIILSFICIIAYLSLPISVLILGQGIQLWHFHERFIRIFSFTTIIFILYSLSLFYEFFKKNLKKLESKRILNYLFLKRLILILLVILSLSVTIKQAYVFSQNNQHQRGNLVPEEPLLTNYRDDFVLLTKELTKKEYKDCKVMGTFDFQLCLWWVAFNRGYSYTPDPFLTTVPDYEIESRLINLCKIIGMPNDNFKKFINQSYVHVYWLGHNKYEASSLYTFYPIADYNKDEQEKIRVSGFDATWWNIIIPNSERLRLLNRYLNEPIIDNLKLDLVVLTNDKIFKSNAPPQGKFILSYKNPTFRVWRRKENEKKIR